MTAAVRVATHDDAAAIARVHVLSWQGAYRGQVPDEVLDGLSVEQRQLMWQSILSAPIHPDHHVDVVTEDGAVIGFGHVCPSRDPDALPQTGEVSSIYLAPAAWGMGAGRLLMASLVAQMTVCGFTQATLWVLKGNARARHFYEDAGWVCDGSEKTETMVGTQVTEVRYRRALTAD